MVSAKGQGPPGRGRTLGILTSTCPRSRTRLSCCTCVRPPGAAWVEGLEGGPGRTEVAAGDRRRAGTGPRAQGSCFMQGTWGVAGPVHQRSCKANTDHKKKQGKKLEFKHLPSLTSEISLFQGFQLTLSTSPSLQKKNQAFKKKPARCRRRRPGREGAAGKTSPSGHHDQTHSSL